MDSNSILTTILSFDWSIWGLVKLFFLLVLLIYNAFAVVVIRQVNLMKQVLDGILENSLILIAWVHFAVAIFVFVLALLIL